MRSPLRQHLPLVALATIFLALGPGTFCTSTDGAGNDASASTDAGVDGRGSDTQDDVSTRSCQSEVDCSNLPPSVCLSSTALAYFTAPQCVQGHCQWTREVRDCPCLGNGCFSTTTAGGATGAGGGPGDLDAGPSTTVTADGGPCDSDTSDGSVCELPRSICVDGSWLAYFTNPVCSAAGRCEWETRYRKCMNICIGGGCNTNITN